MKELKNKYSSRLVLGVETGSWSREDLQQGGSLRTMVGKAVTGRVGSPTLACGETGRNNWGVKQITPQGTSTGK